MFCDSVYEIREGNGIRKKRGMGEAEDVCKGVKGDGSRTKTAGAGMKSRSSLPILFPFYPLLPVRSRRESKGQGSAKKERSENCQKCSTMNRWNNTRTSTHGKRNFLAECVLTAIISR